MKQASKMDEEERSSHNAKKKKKNGVPVANGESANQ